MGMFGNNSKKQLEDAYFQMKLASKQLARQSVKAEKEAKQAENKVKLNMQKGNPENARIFAENAIRKKQESVNFLRMSSRLDATSSRIQTAITMQTVTKSMGMATKGMDKALQSMDLVKITSIMEKFESQFEDLDVQTGVMDNAMSGAVTSSVPEDQVEALISQVADEHGLQMQEELNAVPAGKTALPTISNEEEAGLSDRLKALREME
ncbi:hypothetical protein SARC_02173 [Sphaeroforma arctica JP610]|uniref:Charged multivesicular body protein 1b n=1 Tax=Sphaeroforma arctica JP610 TaxID=667725 RepID=A0A0L0G9F9_9EUKA|nr:hypothetical protein SARC_02173 [Sphaeroforma arctica JP610]KNC85652.1 hypothetical protein SARC_02173 [Sphaeroforma arctica JP610]|eukprot:XP_014159554.1 hypothetical protein SARC_02173 [Sphaeroforma arctica JP610]